MPELTIHQTTCSATPVFESSSLRITNVAQAASPTRHPPRGYVQLIGAISGNRYCIPDVGYPPFYFVHTKSFQAQDLLGKRLIPLDEHGNYARNAAGALDLSETVAGFINAHDAPQSYGLFTSIATATRHVCVVFGPTRLQEPVEEVGMPDLEGVATPDSEGIAKELVGDSPASSPRSVHLEYERNPCGL